MSLDLTTLRLLKTRERFEKYHKSVPAKALDTRTRIILDDFGAFFREFPDVQKIEPGPFGLWFKGFRHPKLADEDMSVYNQLFQRIAEDADPALEQGFMARLVAANTAAELTAMLEKWAAGEEFDFGSVLRARVDEFESALVRKVKNPQVLTPIEDMLDREENNTGFSFRLSILNQHIKPLTGGDLVLIAARPDKGKTSFMADNLSFMAPQVDVLYPGENRSILWLNNEGPGDKIVMRSWQAALGMTVEQMVELNKQPAVKQEKYKTALREQYMEAIGGRGGALRVFDIHGMNNAEVEELILKWAPAIVVFDMVDNIRFDGLTNNGGQRTDQILEAMYQWVRMIAVKHDFVALATSQISVDGDGMQFPTQAMLKDSKTGKQGALDLQIMIGSVNDPMLEHSRWIGVVKSKKKRTGMSMSPNCEVLFDMDRSRFKEPPQ